jgi:putative transposase
MKTARYGDAKIMGIFKQEEGGTPVSELCREHGISNANFYKWRAKFGGMDASLITEMKDMRLGRPSLGLSKKPGLILMANPSSPGT